MTLDLSRPFTRAEALAAGVTVSDLAGPRFQRIFHNVYLSAQVKVGVLERARAALTVCPADTYLSHHTAGALWGGWVPDTVDTHVTAPPGSVRSRRRGIFAHRGNAGTAPVRHRGVALSTPLQVFKELASLRVDLVSLVVFGDSLVKAGRVTPDVLIASVENWTGKGARTARRAARLVRAGVDSAPESRLRMLVVLAGLPEPEVNLIVRTSEGEWHRRFDLCFPELKVIIEYDGKQHLRDPERWSKDILRREMLERQGWTLIIVNADALFNHPAGTLERIRTVLRDRGCRDLPARADAVWHRHFSTRSAA
jgi:hypothetical protein